jgi:hypothetical protein
MEVISVPCHGDVSSVFAEIQGDCKVTANRIVWGKDRYKMDRRHGFS